MSTLAAPNPSLWRCVCCGNVYSYDFEQPFLCYLNDGSLQCFECHCIEHFNDSGVVYGTCDSRSNHARAN